MTRVLLMEDNTDMLTMLAQVLEWGGYEVIAARDGNEGLGYLASAGALPDVIISDLSMPNLDGYSALRQVRNTPEWANIPFVVMSAHSSPADHQAALDQGADDFLTKPFNLEDFQNVLKRWQTS